MLANGFGTPSFNQPLKLLIERHETPFIESIERRSKLEIKHIKVLTYSIGFLLTYKYLEVIIQFFKPKIFDEKVDVLFVFLFY